MFDTVPDFLLSEAQRELRNEIRSFVADPEWDGDPMTEAIRTFNDKAVADERVEMTMLPVADGLTLARRK